MSEPWQHFYQSQRLKLSYWTWGEANRPPLILVHGARDHARNWDRIAEAFRDDYHVLACDLRGHGDSEWVEGSTYSVVEHIPDLVALIDLVGGRAPVVAHSFGAWIALLTAGVFPEKFEKVVAMEGMGVALEDRPAVSPETIRKWVMKVRALEGVTPRVYPSFRAAADRMREANNALTEEMAEHLARWAAHGIDNGWVWKFDPWVRQRHPLEITRQEMEPIWRNIDSPVLHVIGETSHFKREKFHEVPLDSYFNDSRTEVVRDAGHWMHHDQTDVTVNLIRDFLGTPPPPRPED